MRRILLVLLVLLASGTSAAKVWNKSATVKAERQKVVQVTQAAKSAEIVKQGKRQQAYLTAMKRWKALPKSQQAKVKKPVWTEKLIN